MRRLGRKGVIKECALPRSQGADLRKQDSRILKQGQDRRILQHKHYNADILNFHLNKRTDDRKSFGVV